MKDFINMGLPSGTLWEEKNRTELFDFYSAYNEFMDELPTTEHFEELLQYCYVSYDNKNSSIILTSSFNANQLTFYLSGFRNHQNKVITEGHNGYYWSKDVHNNTFPSHLAIGILTPQFCPKVKETTPYAMICSDLSPILKFAIKRIKQ